MNFSVWAPLAKSVDMIVSDRRIPLQPALEGNWTVDVDPAQLGGGYKYSIDGGPAFPDPRSRWQPDGVHGCSYPVDLAALRRIQSPAFSPKPLSDAVIYEIHVGTFTPQGTYVAAQEKLGYLAELGVTHVELMPIATFPGAHGWGYDGVDLYAPLPAYGTPEELARFIRACHDRGLAVLLDVVYNHVGPDGNYLSNFGPYFTDRVKTPWGEAINYDGPHSDGVRRFFIDNAIMWLRDYGFDGLRLDAVHAIFSFESVHLLEELAAEVHAAGEELQRSLVLIAESDLNDPRYVLDSDHGGYGLDAHWADDFHHAVHRFFTGESAGYYSDFQGLEHIAAALRDGYIYQGQYSVYRRRRHGRPPRGITNEQLVICSQNHDQIGNRAQGERLSMLLEPPQLKAIAALTLLSPFVPMLFQGEEWGSTAPFLYFTDHQDPELGRLVAEGRSREFNSFVWSGEVPNPQDAVTFERSKIDWSQASQAWHEDLLKWYRRLIQLRHGKPQSAAATPAQVDVDPTMNWLRLAHGGLLTVCNFAGHAQPIPSDPQDWQLILSSTDGDTDPAAAMPPQGTRVFASRSAGG